MALLITPSVSKIDRQRTRDDNIASRGIESYGKKKIELAKDTGMNAPRYRKLKEIVSSKCEEKNDLQVSMSIPLSELLLDVPLIETESYIFRPKELREEEWTKRHDFPRIPRPMNVFLLYRRAVGSFCDYTLRPALTPPLRCPYTHSLSLLVPEVGFSPADRSDRSNPSASGLTEPDSKQRRNDVNNTW